ncbi:uncharacterized protein LOC106661458 [Cimex lectularius]|uniref:Uncharacterized protein n=1 Tax=Cimex lectularius TaxID=79782 RepID=A0A8I6TCX9_CIMLE|nr:uncharacterized protein LOC106661458 [Cimex lectularius]
MYHLKKSKANRKPKDKVFKSASQPNIHVHSEKNHQDKRNQVTEKECVFCDGLFSMCSELLKKNVLKIINDHFKVIKEVKDAPKQNTQVEKSPKERLDTAPLQTNELHQEMVGKTSGPDKEPHHGQKDASPSNADYSLKMPLQIHCEKDCLCHEILIKVAEAIAAHSHFKDQEGSRTDKDKHAGKDTLGTSLKKRRKAYYKKKEDKYLIRNVKDQTYLVPKVKKSRNKGIDQSGTKRKNNIEDTTSSAYHELHNFKNKPTIEIPIVNDRRDSPKGTNGTHEKFNSETDSSTNDTSQMSDKENGYLPNVYRERDDIQTDLSQSLSPLQGNEPKATHLENRLDSCQLEDRLISILQKIALIYAEHNRKKKRHTVQNKPSSSHEDKDNFSDLDPLRRSYTEAEKEPKVALLYSELNNLLNETLRENSARCDKDHKCTLNQRTPTGYKNRRKCSSPWEKEDNFSDLESLRLIFRQHPSDVKGESKISEIVVSKVKSPRSANKQHTDKENRKKKRNSCRKKLWPSPAEREEKMYDSDPLRDSSEVEMEPKIAELSSRENDNTFDNFPRRVKDPRTTIKPHTPTDYEKKRKSGSIPHDRMNAYKNKKFQKSSEDGHNNQSDKDSSEEIIHFIPSTPEKERKTHQKKMTLKKHCPKMKVVHPKKKMDMNDDTVDSESNSTGEEYILLKRKKKQRPQEDSSSEDLYEVLRRPTHKKNKNANLRNRRENKRKSIAGHEIPDIEKISSSESLEETSDHRPENERPRKQNHSPDIKAQQNMNLMLINEQIKELEHLRGMFLKCLNGKESPKIPDKKSDPIVERIKSGEKQVRNVENERKSPEKHSEPDSEDEGLKKQNQSLNNKNKQEMFLKKIEDQKKELQKLREQCLSMDRQIPQEDLKISDKKSPEKDKEGPKRAIKKSKVTIIPVRERLIAQLLNSEVIELFIAAQCPGLAKTPESKDADKQRQQTDTNTENTVSPSKESMKTIHKTNDQVEMFNSVEFKDAMENTKDTVEPIKNIESTDCFDLACKTRQERSNRSSIGSSMNIRPSKSEVKDSVKHHPSSSSEQKRLKTGKLASKNTLADTNASSKDESERPKRSDHRTYPEEW